MEFYTIGVYNSTEQEFFNKLASNNVDTFCDIRQRRGVRGSKYAFVNSNKLQEKLNDLGIKYAHISALAPTSEIRGLQKEIDLGKGELKKERHELGRIFVIEYKNKILKNFDFDEFFAQLDSVGASRIVFFCVEEFPEACHRSIIADKLSNSYNYKITHL
jgi:uncharacterized protein (DUF488 family)